MKPSTNRVNGALRILRERARQKRESGYSADHDAEHVGGELARAAKDLLFAYLFPNADRSSNPHFDQWGLVERYKGNPETMLVVAGALIAAEIDRVNEENEEFCSHDELDHGICLACGENRDMNSDFFGKKQEGGTA